MKVGIFGAGIAGLYTAIKLRLKGKNIAIYDHRLGEHTRIGHLSEQVFTRAQQNIGKEFWPGGSGSIKDLQDKLYSIVNELQIPTIKKRFVRVEPHQNQPGVIVSDNNHEEFVAADCVLDCTGSKRAVIHNINRILSHQPPFKLRTLADIAIPNQMIAYLQLSPTQVSQLDYDKTNLFSMFPKLADIGSLNYARSLVKLRAFGWNEMTYPRLNSRLSGTDHVSLYLHVPNQLARENYEAWMQTVVGCYTDSFNYMPIPKIVGESTGAYPLSIFKVTAQALDTYSFQAKDFPTIIALGDAQIDPDYVLGNGIYNGMLRINHLIDLLTTQDNLSYFSPYLYDTMIESSIYEHEKDISDLAQTQQTHFSNAVNSAAQCLREAADETPDPSEKVAFFKVLHEIKSRRLDNQLKSIAKQSMQHETHSVRFFPSNESQPPTPPQENDCISCK